MSISEQSKSIRYGNSACHEIGVKFNRNLELVILVEDDKHKIEFTFYREDAQTLEYFENVFTNLYSYLISFDVNYGRKVNDSQTSMGFYLKNKDGVRLSVEVDVNGDESTIAFTLIEGCNCVEFYFTKEDKQILEMFRKDLSDIIKNKGIKLPPVPLAPGNGTPE